MAKFIDTKYENQNIEKRKSYRTKGLIGYGIAILTFLYWMYLVNTGQVVQGFKDFIFVAIFFLGGGLFGQYNWNKYKGLDSGLKGENTAAQYLSTLSDEYTVLQNIPLEKDGRRTELDFLVLSQYGIDIVEVKNHNGKIVGREEDSTWTQHKIGQKGNPYTSEMKNPLKQLGFQIHLLSIILKENHVNVWIDGFVLMPTADSVQVNSDDVVQNSTDLVNRICSKKESKVSQDTIDKIVNILSKH